MRIIILALALLGVLHFSAVNAQTGIYINEAMASNRNTIADSTGAYEDWLELYNSSTTARSLNGYYITNDISQPHLFRLSDNLQISARGFLLLWASKDTTRGKTHLPFKISASGESLYLYAPDGQTLIDSLSITDQQKTDVSYGRSKDGSSNFGFFAAPTPRSSNNNSITYSGILNPPVFSKPAGFYGSAFSLSITADDPAATIIYTTDGSDPKPTNINGTVYRYKNHYQQNPNDPIGTFLFDSFRSVIYVSPLDIKDASANPNKISIKSSTYEASFSYAPATLINKGTVIRAIATKEGYLPSEITTSTYFVTTGGANKYTLPVVSISLPENYLYSWDTGIYNAGVDFEKWRALNPTATAGGGTPTNWQRDTEFPASLELFTANTPTRQLQTNIGLHMNGNYSRRYGQKAFRIYFRKSIGASDLNYRIFSDLPYTNYERLVLSNAGQDMPLAHMRDMAAQASVQHLNVGTQHQQPAIAFVNGEFWGLFNIRQRYDDNHFQQTLGIHPDSLDLVVNQSTAQYGTNTAINHLRNFFATNDMALASNYQYIQTQIDIDNFIDYQLIEIFFGNNDWPSNNITYYRKRVPYTPGAAFGHDGRFRWVLNDLDRAFGQNNGGVAYNTLAWATGTSTGSNPSTWATDMLRKLLANVEFKNKFISRYADLLNTTFLPANIDAVINSFRTILSPHIIEHTQRWRNPSSASSWNANVDAMIKYQDQRPAYAREHLRSLFFLNTEKQLTISVSDTTQGLIAVNTVDITAAFPGVPKNAYPWTGSYYQEVPVTLVAKPKQGYRFVRWSGDTTSTKDTLVVTLTGNKNFTAVFESMPVADSGKVITYWHFNNLPGTASLASANADTSLVGNAVITYPGTGTGYMDRTTGSSVNAQFNQPLGYSLRVRNPSATRSLLLTAPTTGYKNIILSYATTRTTNGAEYQRVFYTTDVTASSVVWQLKADSILVPTPETNPYGLKTVDFSADANTSNNSRFAIKIEFLGPNAAGTSGNDRFDNMTIKGVPLSSQDYPVVSVSADKNNVCANSKITFTAKTTNAGTSPVFQWIKNDETVGANESTFIDSSFQDQDVVYCRLTVNDTTLTSNNIFITVSASDLNITSLIKTSPSACGTNDGDITLNHSGGTAPFSYSLDNVIYVPSNLFANLGEGNYTVYVKDAKGCTASISDVLVKTPEITIAVDKTSPACATADGTITINHTGGTSPFTYSLDGINFVTSNVFSNLPAGTYTAHVKDANDCTASFTEVLSNNSSLVLTGLNAVSPTTCSSSDGSISIAISGGVSPFTYSLDGVNYVASNVFSNLPAGTYTALVKDANDCTASFTEVLSNNSSLVLTGLNAVAPTTCSSNDGSISIAISGGASPFTYSLDGINYATSNVFSNLPAGTYTAHVKDANDCTASLTGIVNQASSSLAILDLIKTSAAPCRNDGSIEIVNSGGYSPFQYSLNNSEYVSESIFPSLAAGTYTAYIKDAQGCIDSLITILDKVTPIVISLTKTPVSACSSGDGIITINGSGGSLPYEYSLDNLSYTRDNTFYDRVAGSFTAYVKDASGCVDSISAVLPKAASLVISNITKVDPSACGTADGTITVDQTGGASPFTYSLDNVNYIPSNVFGNLAEGTYTVYVKDVNGCIASASAVLTKAALLVISNVTKVDPSACGTTDGSITIVPNGGTAPYLYSLDNVTYVSPNVFSNLGASTYTAYVKDANGCVASSITTLARSGSITRELWTGITGTSVATIPLSTPPASISQFTSFETPSNAGDNYGQRLRGYLCAPVSGAYTFYIASDDNGELWLSASADPAAKTRIAFVSGWAASRDWTKFSSQRSVSITLQAGQRYYIEALHKEGVGGDNFAVGWTTPGASSIEVIPGSVLSPFTVTTPNQPPVVSLTTPANNASFAAPATITLSANANDVDGTITKVEFFRGTTLIGTATASPYTITWSNVAAGAYSLTAKATDNGGLSTTSTAVSVSVQATAGCTASGSITRELWTGVSGTSVSTIPLSTPPASISQFTSFETPSNAGDNYGQRLRGYLCAPVSGAYTFYIASDDRGELWLSASADPAAKTRIAFVSGWAASRDWTKFSSQRSVSITLQAGQRYYIEALHKESVGGDNFAVGWTTPGASSIEVIPGSVLSPFTVTTPNQPPVVSLTTPANNASFAAPATITLSANANDVDGTITKVEFFRGTTLIGTATASPYTITWSNVAAGAYSLTAKATDNGGLSTTSTAVSVSVQATAGCTASGSITRELWTGISGTSVSTIPLSTPPASISQFTSFETPSNAGDNYGQRLRGYLCAPVSGAYTFYIASDDNGELWLSASADPAAKTRIAFVSGWAASRDWTKFSSQRSVSITLQAGQRYYIEALHKEGVGGDNFAVGWTTPGASSIEVIPGSVLSPFTVTTPTFTVSSTAPKTNKSVIEQAPVVFGIKVFPNPSKDQFSLIVEGSGNQEVEVIVTDLLGRKMLSARTAPNTVLNFGKNLLTGTYIIQVWKGKKMITHKLVKDK